MEKEAPDETSILTLLQSNTVDFGAVAEPHMLVLSRPSSAASRSGQSWRSEMSP